MCQSTVYLLDDEIMADVMKIEVVPEGVRLTSLFEPARVLSAAVREIDLMKHVVILEPLGAASRRLLEETI